ncbi:MAG TPA: anti-sigma factor [Patescibacteria group bacterium]|nr:anti-sigma factor [Patescibacteria group bacterium]
MIEPRMTCDEVRDLAAGYVLGALERTEEAAVRDHLATCPEAHAEFDELGGVIPAYLNLELDGLELVEPPAALGERIMAAAAADLARRTRSIGTSTPVTVSSAAATTSAPAPSAPAPSAPIAFPTSAERDARRRLARSSPLDWALRIAAVFAIVAVGTWGLGLQRQLDAAQRFDQAVARVVDAAGKPGSATVVLTAATGSRGSGIAAVAPDGSVVLAMRDLPATSGGQVYETWVIVGEQAPVAVGGFTVDANGTAGFTTRPQATPPGAVIALTLEPKAGNTAPMGPVVSSGVAAAPPGDTS